MSKESQSLTRYRRWRSVLLLLVGLPFLPEIVTILVSGFAYISGCNVADRTACATGDVVLSDVIRAALKVGTAVGVIFANGLAAIWLALCYFAIMRGWRYLVSRLGLALIVSLIFAFLPYFGPMLSIGHLVNPRCRPNEGGIPPECIIYGGDIGDAAPAVVLLIWKFVYGALIALAAFVIFAAVASWLAARSTSPREEEGSSAG